MLRAKNLVFAGIAAMIGYVLYHNERFLIQPDNPVWKHYATVGWLLWPHGIAGACALFLAPFQFSERLRKKYTKLHRVSGRVYVVGVLVLAPLGLYIQYWEESLGLPRSFTIAAAVDAALLYVTTGIAFMFAMKRKITQHRQWMTRSYAVALVFFEVRLIGGVTGWETNPQVIEVIIWTCLAASLLLADIANDWQGLRVAVAAPAPSPQRQERKVAYDVAEPA